MRSDQTEVSLTISSFTLTELCALQMNRNYTYDTNVNLASDDYASASTLSLVKRKKSSPQYVLTMNIT